MRFPILAGAALLMLAACASPPRHEDPLDSEERWAVLLMNDHRIGYRREGRRSLVVGEGRLVTTEVEDVMDLSSLGAPMSMHIRKVFLETETGQLQRVHFIGSGGGERNEITTEVRDGKLLRFGKASAPGEKLILEAPGDLVGPVGLQRLLQETGTEPGASRTTRQVGMTGEIMEMILTVGEEEDGLLRLDLNGPDRGGTGYSFWMDSAMRVLKEGGAPRGGPALLWVYGSREEVGALPDRSPPNLRFRRRTEMVGLGDIRRLEGHTDWVRAVAFHPSGKEIASAGDDGSIRIWDVDDGEVLEIIEGQSGWIHDIAYHPAGGTLASAGHDGTVRLWDPSDGQLQRTLRAGTLPVTSVAFFPDGRRLVTGSDDRTVRIWDISTGEAVRILEEHDSSVEEVAVSPDGGTIATLSNEGRLRLFDSGDGHEIRSLEADGRARRSWEGEGLSPADLGYMPVTRGGRALAFAPDGKRLAAAVGCGMPVRVFTLAEEKGWKPVGDSEFDPCSLAFSATGNTLAAGAASGKILLVETNWSGRRWKFLGHVEGVLDLDFHPEGRMLASSGADGMVILWDLDGREM